MKLMNNDNFITKTIHAYADSSGFNVGRALARHFDGIHARLLSGINADLQGI